MKPRRRTLVHMQHNGLAADEEANCNVLLAAVQSGDADGVSHYSKQLEVNTRSSNLIQKPAPTPHQQHINTTPRHNTPDWCGDWCGVVLSRRLIVFLCQVDCKEQSPLLERLSCRSIRLSLFACKADVCIAHLPQAHSHPSELSIRARKAAVAFFMMRKDQNKAGLLQDILLGDVEE
jgi:hypothetical protein